MKLKFLIPFRNEINKMKTEMKEKKCEEIFYISMLKGGNNREKLSLKACREQQKNAIQFINTCQFRMRKKGDWNEMRK